jgi:hypothetical protein
MNSTVARVAIGSIWCGGTESEIKGIQVHRVIYPSGVDLPRSKQKENSSCSRENPTEREKPFSPMSFTGVIQNIGR